MDLSIIIINWNSREYVAACLQSVIKHAPSVPFEILVVDSGSFDGCAEMLAREFPQVRFIQSPDNLGFARANNLAASIAHGHTFLFLNPDTNVNAGATMALYEAVHSHPEAGAVGARLLNTDGSLQTSCVQAFPTILNQILISDLLIRLFPRSRLWGKASLFEQRCGPHEVDAISGAAITMRREVFEKIGGFCEEYFMYSEDIDLCLQARIAGFRNLYVDQAEIIHHGGGSAACQPSRFSTVRKVEALRLYFMRNIGTAYASLFRVIMGASAIARLLLLIITAGCALLSGKSAPRYSFCKWSYVLQWALCMPFALSHRDPHGPVAKATPELAHQ